MILVSFLPFKLAFDQMNNVNDILTFTLLVMSLQLAFYSFFNNVVSSKHCNILLRAVNLVKILFSENDCKSFFQFTIYIFKSAYSYVLF